MSMSAIDQLHIDLDFTAYEPELRRIGSVWKDITALQKRVKANPAALKQYRQYLERCINNLKAKGIDDPELVDEELIVECNRVVAALVSLPISDHADGRLPSNFFDWCQAWTPREYETFTTAWVRLEAKHTMRNFNQARLAIEELLVAYLAGFEDHATNS